jgi:transposase
MKMEDIQQGLSKMLLVEQPWILQEIEVHNAAKVVDIHISYERGTQFNCPDCNQSCPVHDSRVHRIRHLDWFNYRCYLNVKVPRVKCDTHGVKVISTLPWGHTGSHFSFFLRS